MMKGRRYKGDVGMKQDYDVLVRQKEILVYQGKRGKLNVLCKLTKEMCQNARIYCISDLEEAYQIAFFRPIELIILRIDMISSYGDLEIRFIEDLKSSKKLAFIPIIVMSSKELKVEHFLGRLHCYGILDTQYDVAYAKEMIGTALQYESVSPRLEFAYFKTGNGIECVPMAQILYIEHHKNRTVVHTVANRFEIVHCSTCQTLNKFGAYDFIRCAKGIVVNMKQLSKIEVKTRRLIFGNSNIWVEYGKNYAEDIYRYIKKGVY